MITRVSEGPSSPPLGSAALVAPPGAHPATTGGAPVAKRTKERHHASMDLPEASERFQVAIGYCDDVVAVHRRAGTGLPGRRGEETTLNRAVIVMAVAAWQVVVENLVLAVLDSARAHAAAHPPATLAAYEGTVRGSVQRFSTPNSQQSRVLLRSVGFDPQPCWNAYSVRGRQAAGTLQEQLDGWLRVRHAIAHADDALPAESVLQHVRQSASRQIASGVALGSVVPPATPGLRLPDAESCVKFMRRIARATGDGFSVEFGLAPVTWA